MSVEDLDEKDFVEKRVGEIEKDLKFCEKILGKEARIELAKRILEDLMKEIRNLPLRGLPENLRRKITQMEIRIRILYHRANALLSLQKEPGE